MLQDKIVQYCAPTLARLKIGSMFGYSYDSFDTFTDELACINDLLNRKGVRVGVLQDNGTRALIYVYRPKELKHRLSEHRIESLMQKFGYEGADINCSINRLRSSLGVCGSFPHEIGIFLGYPLEDVIGFIEHCGSNCKACGQWKVYGDVEKAMGLFAKYRRCELLYMRLFRENGDIEKLTVCA